MFDIIVCFIVMDVRSLNYISAAINMFKWKRKEAVVFDIFRLIVTMRKIAVAKVSWLMLSNVAPVELVKSELPRMQVQNLHIGIEKWTQTYVTRLFA